MDTKDFGGRLRQERVKAGLSQSDLAAGIMSASHISLLESGQRSPSPEMLEQLAERLGVTGQFLTSGPTSRAAESRRKNLLFAEMALKNGDVEFAEKSLRAIVGELDSTESIEFAIRARHLYAMALEGLGRLEEASRELRQAINSAKASGLPLEAVEMTITLSACAKESGDFVTAIELVTEAQLSFPRELRQSATYARLISSAIAIHYLRGDYVRAQDLAEQALNVFDDRTDPTARAAILWNASLAADANDDTSKALLLAQRAAGLYSEGDDRRFEGQLRVAISWLFTRQTPPDVSSAREQLIRAEELLTDSGALVDKAYLETELARVEWLDQNYDVALQKATTALGMLEGSKDRLLSADAHLLAARAQISLGHEIESGMHLDAARSILAGMEPSRQNSLAWRELGDIYANMELKAEALDSYREALQEAGVPASPMAFVDSAKAEEDAGISHLQ
ncbi:MAG TPA: helix-turn-helix domain-containing protein [Candidatus Nanopelagicaceae bacterium]|nr:helix-turn-helix domain-containing protein [Candidatus Nanopelagicaceae bacterium]